MAALAWSEVCQSNGFIAMSDTIALVKDLQKFSGC
jgi:hypothetical protein